MKKIPKVSGIYKIENLVNGKRYIGSAKNLRRRKRDHFDLLRKGRHPNNPLQAAFMKYGVNALHFSVLELVPDINQLIDREQYYLDLLGSHVNEHGYNLCKVASSTLGIPCSEEKKKKISEANKGKARHTEKWKAELSEKMRSFEFTDEIRAKISRGLQGRKLSTESLRKMSETKRGKKKTNEQRARLSVALRASPRIAAHCRGLSEKQRKLNDDQVAEIKTLRSDGLSWPKIGSLFGVGITTARTWGLR